MCFHVAERFCVIFYDIHKKTRKEFEQFRFGLQNTNKYMWRENILAHAHYTNRIFESKEA